MTGDIQRADSRISCRIRSLLQLVEQGELLNKYLFSGTITSRQGTKVTALSCTTARSGLIGYASLRINAIGGARVTNKRPTFEVLDLINRAISIKEKTMADRVLTFVNAGEQDVSEVTISTGVHSTTPANETERVTYVISYPEKSTANPLTLKEEFAKAAEAIVADANNRNVPPGHP